MRLTASLLAALLLTVGSTARADSFQFTINSSVQETITNTDNDSYMGIYSTQPDAWGTQTYVHSYTPYYENSPFSNISFSLPAGSSISSATLNLILPSTWLQGTAAPFIYTMYGISPPDPYSNVSIAPTLGTATSNVSVGIQSISGVDSIISQSEGNFTVFDVSQLLSINGSEISTTNLDTVRLSSISYISTDISAQGYNWSGYIGGIGQATIPYELEVTGTYSPVPEPSSIALLGTGLMGFAGFARRKFPC